MREQQSEGPEARDSLVHVCGLLRVQGEEDTEWEADWWQVGSGYGECWRNAKVAQWVISQEAPPPHYQQGSPHCILAKGFDLGGRILSEGGSPWSTIISLVQDAGFGHDGACVWTGFKPRESSSFEHCPWPQRQHPQEIYSSFPPSLARPIADTMLCVGPEGGAPGKVGRVATDRGFLCLRQDALQRRVGPVRGSAQLQCVCVCVRALTGLGGHGMHLLPASASEDMEAQGLLCRQRRLGRRQEAAREQVEEASKARQPRQDPEPQGQVLQGALQLGVQEDDLAFGDTPLPRVVEDVAGHAGLVLQGQLGLDPGLCVLPVQVVPLHQPRQLCVPVTEDGAGALLRTAGPSLPPMGKSRAGGGEPLPSNLFQGSGQGGGRLPPQPTLCEDPRSSMGLRSPSASTGRGRAAAAARRHLGSLWLATRPAVSQ